MYPASRVNVRVLICTHGTDEWRDLAVEHALPSIASRGTSVQCLHLPDATLAEVRNRAARDAVGVEWLCYLDADDQLDEGYVAAMQRAYLREGPWDAPALLLPHVQRVVDGRRHGWPLLPAAGRAVLDVNAGVIGTLVPRDLFLEVGGFRELDLYEDWDLWLRCLRAGARPVSVPDAVYLVDGEPGRNQPDQATRQRVYREIRAEHAPHLDGVRCRWPR